MSSHIPISSETLRPCLGLLALLVLHILWLRGYPTPQFRRTAARARGLERWRGQPALPRRFDNNDALFSSIYALLMHALGPRADILTWLRLAVVPWYLLAL